MMPLNGTRCELGEGAFWHPAREAFFWFDITGCRLHSVARSWNFDEMVSAMGWIDDSGLIIASQSRLMLFDLKTAKSRTLCALEAENPRTRSNDGRADPQGGFWISTMDNSAAPGAGSIWRWYRGELRRLYTGLSIPNAISFPPDGLSVCFTDTPRRQVMRVTLDAQGWPQGMPECWLDLRDDGLNPDGAVIDAAGVFWVAQWGASRVAGYGLDGQFLRAVEFPAAHTSCPAFGGDTLGDLYCTTAREGRTTPTTLDGATFRARAIGSGQAEHRVLI